MSYCKDIFIFTTARAPQLLCVPTLAPQRKQGCLLLLMSHPVLAKVPQCTAGCGAQTHLLVSKLMLYNSLGLQTASWETVRADVGTQSSTICTATCTYDISGGGYLWGSTKQKWLPRHSLPSASTAGVCRRWLRWLLVNCQQLEGRRRHGVERGFTSQLSPQGTLLPKGVPELPAFLSEELVLLKATAEYLTHFGAPLTKYSHHGGA